MTCIQPHEVLKASGVAEEFKQGMGTAAFVSHQWVGYDHPDPDFKQFRVLQEALTYIMTELESIPPDGYSRVICHCQPLPTQAFRTSTIFVWYDYFSCPQLGSKASGHLGEEDDLSKAVGSIPSYVLRCEYFFALCPVVAAVEELWAQKALRPWELVEWELSESLITCAVFRGGSAEFVQRLVELRANVNHQRTRSLLPASNFEISEGLGALQYRLGREGVWEAYCYHCNGMTPLMSAVLCGQHESAAALIAAGARLDLVNSRNWTAADFGRERSPPDFLHEAFAGCTEGCERVAAVARGYSVMKI
ncbi:unnamed protein product [Symbiodinium natans]|uniref:Uncharacterized protein n=1 Tax=Symbiodinium natans TaxID=878477 RepID=A0A812NYT3_9DINO|nr:unnamed protein product [Symbiodinium natans]